MRNPPPLDGLAGDRPRRRRAAAGNGQEPGGANRPRADELAWPAARSAASTRRPSGRGWRREARAPTRFVALPLRVLRPDPETDFLAFSVPDAVSIALAALSR